MNLSEFKLTITFVCSMFNTFHLDFVPLNYIPPRSNSSVMATVKLASVVELQFSELPGGIAISDRFCQGTVTIYQLVCFAYKIRVSFCIKCHERLVVETGKQQLVGHLDFVRELLMSKPEFATELSSEGHTPMHMASANGHVEVVRELMKIDHELCRHRGTDGRTPFHLAALKGKVDVLQEMLSGCAESIGDLTPQGETALHLAIRYSQIGSLSIMVECIRTMNKDDILNKRDEQGNSLLHLATWKKQRQVLELLLANRSESLQPLEVNAVNDSGLTPLDVLLIFPSEAGDREMQEVLQRAGGLRAQDLDSSLQTSSQACNNSTTGVSSNLVDYFKFHKGRDSPGSVRDALLVIAVLVATATYQVGINPPGGTWQDSSGGHIAGRSILGTYNSVTYTCFAAFNSIGFSLSLFVIGVLTSKFPMRLEFQICLVALYVTYNTAIVYMAPESVKVYITVFTSLFPILIPIAAYLWRKYVC